MIYIDETNIDSKNLDSIIAYLIELQSTKEIQESIRHEEIVKDTQTSLDSII